MSVTQQQVVTLLENVLFESGTQAQANAATWQANAATSVSSLAATMAASGEEKIAATVVGYYISALGRAPSAAEIRYYVGIAEQGLTSTQISAGDVSGATWDQISQYFSHSPEFMTRGGLDATGGLDQTGLLLQAVPWLYESVLGRSPSTEEVAYYDNLVVNGTSLGTLFRYFTSSAEFHTDTDAEIASALASFGESAVSGGNTSLSTVTIGTQTPPPPSTGTPTATFGVLTTGTDTIDDSTMSGAHTYAAILGTGATLNAADHLTGNGLATLAITDTTDAHVLLPGTLAGISAITVGSVTTPVGNVGSSAAFGDTFDVSGVSGLSQLTVTSSGSAGDYITATSSVAVTLTTNSGTIYLDNAGTVTLTDNLLTTLELTETVNAVVLHDPGHATPYTLTLNIGSLTLGAFQDVDAMVTTLDISNSAGTSIIDGITDTGLVELDVSGSAAVTLGTSGSHIVLGSSVTTIDLSGNASGGGTSYLDVHSNATIHLGNGGTYLTLGSGSDGSVIDDASGTGVNTIIDNSTAGAASIIVGNSAGNSITDNSGNTAAQITVGNGIDNAVVANSVGGGTFNFGSGVGNTLDLKSSGNNVVNVVAEASTSTVVAGLTISHTSASDQISFGTTLVTPFFHDNIATDLASLISDASGMGAGGVVYGNLNGSADLYFVQTADGTTNFGEITVVKIVGGQSYVGALSISGHTITL